LALQTVTGTIETARDHLVKQSHSKFSSFVQRSTERGDSRRGVPRPWKLIWGFTLLATTVIGALVMPQSVNDPLVGKWKLDWIHSGFFPEHDLLFEKTGSELSDYIFQFNEDGTISYRHTVEECPVGVLTMKDGHWTHAQGLLRLELRGLKIADYWYWWIIDYRVEKNGNTMYLKVATVVKNRQISSLLTWDELLHG
jgi:hypothetical protein